MTRKAIILVFCNLFLLSAKAQVVGDFYNTVSGTNGEPVIYDAVSLNSFQLVTANLQVSKEDNLQKVVVAPLKFLNINSLLRETKINLAQKNGITTFGIGFGFDNGSPYYGRGDRILGAVVAPAERRRIFADTAVNGVLSDSNGDGFVSDTTETEYHYDKYKAQLKKDRSIAYAGAYEKILKGSLKLTLGYNLSMFEIIAGDEVDKNEDGAIDNYRAIESHNFSFGGTYMFSLKTAVSLNVHQSFKYSGPQQGEKQVGYIGGSFSFAQRIAVLDRDYQNSEDYLKTLFVPALVFGISMEYQKANKNLTYAKEGITETIAATPFVEFKINPKNQFRLGVPFKKYSGLKDEASFGPFVQWTLQIAKTE